MKIIQGYPPNYDEIAKKFDLSGRDVVFAFGDVLYNPSGNKVPSDLMVHEETHGKQQKNEVMKWWEKYLKNKEFRLSQEIEAYQNQYQYFKEHCRSSLVLVKYLDFLAKELSSEMYGNMISYEKALQLIK